jgi:hypothetical protein
MGGQSPCQVVSDAGGVGRELTIAPAAAGRAEGVPSRRAGPAPWHPAVGVAVARAAPVSSSVSRYCAQVVACRCAP